MIPLSLSVPCHACDGGEHQLFETFYNNSSGGISNFSLLWTLFLQETNNLHDKFTFEKDIRVETKDT